jgi:hypothetical protein
MGYTAGEFDACRTRTCIHRTRQYTIPMGTGFNHGVLVNTTVQTQL